MFIAKQCKKKKIITRLNNKYLFQRNRFENGKLFWVFTLKSLWQQERHYKVIHVQRGWPRDDPNTLGSYVSKTAEVFVSPSESDSKSLSSECFLFFLFLDFFFFFFFFSSVNEKHNNCWCPTYSSISVVWFYLCPTATNNTFWTWFWSIVFLISFHRCKFIWAGGHTKKSINVYTQT